MSKNDSFDDFWDLEKIIPPKMRKEIDEKIKMAEYIAHTYDTSPVEVILTAKESVGENKLNTIEMRPDANGNTKISFSSKKEEPPRPDASYIPENPFINEVKLYKRKDFGYYSTFYEDGLKYLGREGSICLHIHYFSYVPQYSQLSNEMLDFYFYMRSSLRNNSPIKADYSYILLYIFELLNIEPNKEKALSQLSLIWRAYRKEYSRLDPLMKEWISDFCLINRLSPRREELGSAYEVALSGAVVKELFICAGKSREESLLSKEMAEAFLTLCTNYNWRNSKFATEENIPLFEKHILGAIRAVLASVSREKKDVFIGKNELKRDAFLNALCTPNNKYRIEVSYSSLARSHEMRFLISDVIKHTENRIRAYLGIKSRLTVYSLPIETRKIIDDYMDASLGKRKAPKKEEVHEYDKLYEIPKREFSLENAKRIEEASWKTTQLLVDAFEEKEAEPEKIEIVLPREEIEEDFESVSDEERLLSALSAYSEFISACLAVSPERQSEEAKKLRKLTDSVADEINELATEIYGDIILEKDGEAYIVIEDYKEIFYNG